MSDQISVFCGLCRWEGPTGAEAHAAIIHPGASVDIVRQMDVLFILPKAAPPSDPAAPLERDEFGFHDIFVPDSVVDDPAAPLREALMRSWCITFSHDHPGRLTCEIAEDYVPSLIENIAPSDPAAPLDVERLRPVIDKALSIQQRARRVAISAEDWRYTNGYNDCLAAVLGVLDPDDTLRWVRDPEAEAQRQARAALPTPQGGRP